MFRNYFISSFRNLWRHKFYTVINLLGMSIGLSCFVLIFMYVDHELSYDRFHKKHERIFRITGKLELEGQGEHSSSCPHPVAPTLINDYPHLIEKCVRLFNFQDPQQSLKYGNKIFTENDLYFADSAFFEIFDFELKEGNPKNVLSKPNSIVITESMAKKYFGNENPIGKTLKYDGYLDIIVTGVSRDPELNSHIRYNALISFISVEKIAPWTLKNWVWNPCWTYVLMKNEGSAKELKQQFPKFVQKYYPDFLKPQVTHDLQPLTDIHLHSHLDYEMHPNNDVSLVYIFSVIGVFILIIGCVNYTNLATARSATRAREIAIRKVSGATRPQLIGQFMAESALVSLISVLIALALIELLLPFFNTLSGKSFTHTDFSSGHVLFKLMIAGLGTAFVSGIYPAFFLSSFSPAGILKGNSKSTTRGAGLRKILVVLQFSISIILIISTGIIFEQFNYLQTKNLGFDKSDLVVIPVRIPMLKAVKQFIPQIKQVNGVVNVATANDIIGKSHNTHEFNYEGLEKGKWKYYPCLLVNEDFVNTMKIELIAGRNFSRDVAREDSLSVIVNEEIVKEMGWKSPQDAIGKRFNSIHGYEKVIGVAKNFNGDPLNEQMGPFVLDLPHLNDKDFWTKYIYIRMANAKADDVMEELKVKWQSLTNDFPFEYMYLNETLSSQYQNQEKLLKLMSFFSILAVFIACIGLYALASFTAEKRTREIGIRKVMGASSYNIVMLLCIEFMKLVGIAVLIACPIAWFMMNSWLENFSFHIEPGVAWFIGGVFLISIIALLTIIFKAFRMAVSNPVDALRHE